MPRNKAQRVRQGVHQLTANVSCSPATALHTRSHGCKTPDLQARTSKCYHARMPAFKSVVPFHIQGGVTVLFTYFITRRPVIRIARIPI